MLRPSLCIAAARACGAEQQDAIRVAVALELFHNAFLVHDDVEDDSDLRRGQPTLHRLHGAAVAVNVGDALTLLGLRALIDTRWRLGTRVAFHLLEEAERMARESVEGQAIDVGWRRSYLALFLAAVGIALIATQPRVALVVLAYTYLLSAFIGMAWSRLRKKSDGTIPRPDSLSDR